MSLLSLLGTGSLSADEVSKLIDLADFGNILSLINEITLSLAFTWAPGDVGNLFSAIFIKMGQSPRYSTIYYSSRLEVMLYYSKVRKGLLTYAPAIPVNMLISYSFPPTDGRFILYSIASRFIYNFWLPMLFIAMITGAWLITWLVEFLIKDKAPKAQKGITPHFIGRKIRVSLQNFLVGLIYCNLGDIILYAILEWQVAKYYHGSDWFSFSLSLLFIILILVILGRHAFLIWQYQQLKKTEKTPQGKQKLTDFKYNREGLKLMFESFKDTSLFDQGFLLFFLLRIALSYLFFGCLINHPQVEAIMIFVITVLFIAFACFKRPFNSILDFIQYILFEVVTLLVNICLLVLATYDAQEQLKESSRNAVSEIILFSTLIFGFLSPIFLVIKGVMLILNYYRGRPTVKVAENLNQSTAVNNSVTHDHLVGIDNSRNSYQMEKEMNPMRPRQRKAERLEETEHSIGEIYDAPDNHTLHPPQANNYRNNLSPNQYNNNNNSRPNNYNNDNSPQGNNYYNNNNGQGGQGNVVLKKKVFGKNGGYVNSERQDRNYYDQNQNGNYTNDNDNGNYYNNGNGNGNRYNENGYGERGYGGNNVPNYRNNYRDRSADRVNDYVRTGERRVIAQSQRAKRQDYGRMEVGPVRANRVFNRRLDRDAYREGQLPQRGYENVQETHFRSNIEGRNRYV